MGGEEKGFQRENMALLTMIGVPQLQAVFVNTTSCDLWQCRTIIVFAGIFCRITIATSSSFLRS